MNIRFTFIKAIIFLSLFSSITIVAQESGAVRLLGHSIPPQGGSYVAGCWGWTDTVSHREYAILGGLTGTSFVEITNPAFPVEVDFVPGPNSSWRELQTHSHYAYVVSEGGGGVQIIDLSYLPDSVHLVKSFTYSDGSKNINRSHTNHIRDGYLYLNGSSTWTPGGAVIFSLADPENPAFMGTFMDNYFHDSFVRNDTMFGATIYRGGIDIVDVTDKENPSFLASFTYPGAGTHNCATTEDGRYLLTTDEINNTPKTLKIWDISDIFNVTKVAEYQADPASIVHNVFVKGNLAYMSYYTDGLRVIDISDPINPVEVGGYDTYEGTSGGYTGAWSTYPFFPSGKIIIGDMVTGLYIVDINPNAPLKPSSFNAYSDYTTPSSALLSWNDPETIISGDPLTNFVIHIYRDGQFIAAVDSGVEQYVDTGLVLHQQYAYALRAVITNDSSATTSFSVYAGGHASPQPPAEFSRLNVEFGTKLTWRTPTKQADETPLNDLAMIEIYRDALLIDSVAVSFSDTGVVMEYTDSVTGYHAYTLAARDNEHPNNSSLLTESLFGYGGAALSTYAQSFDAGMEGFYSTGTWAKTSSISYSGGFSFTDSPDGNYAPSSTTYFFLPPIVVTANHVLSFQEIGIIGSSDFGFVQITSDGVNYSNKSAANALQHSQWQDNSADSGDWFPKTISLSAYAGDTVTIRFLFTTDPGSTKDGWYIDDIFVGSTTAAGDEPGDGLPLSVKLEQNYPNPFNPSTVITYSLPARSYVTLKVYDILGKEAATLVDGIQDAGFQSKTWDATGMPAGVYYYRLQAGTFADTKKLLLLR